MTSCPPLARNRAIGQSAYSYNVFTYERPPQFSPADMSGIMATASIEMPLELGTSSWLDSVRHGPDQDCRCASTTNADLHRLWWSVHRRSDGRVILCESVSVPALRTQVLRMGSVRAGAQLLCAKMPKLWSTQVEMRITGWSAFPTLPATNFRSGVSPPRRIEAGNSGAPVAVGTTIAGRPLRRSVRARLRIRLL
jgi:hypothetical protein